jgi:putative flippase GtrA
VSFWRKLIAFLMVGGFCTLLNLAVQWFFTSWVGLHYLISTLISFFAITPVGFWLNKLHAFATPRALARAELPRYFATMALSLGVNLALMYVLVSLLGLWYLAAAAVVTVLLVAANFVTHDRWSFGVAR